MAVVQVNVQGCATLAAQLIPIVVPSVVVPVALALLAGLWWRLTLHSRRDGQALAQQRRRVPINSRNGQQSLGEGELGWIIGQETLWTKFSPGFSLAINFPPVNTQSVFVSSHRVLTYISYSGQCSKVD